jgi:hypothetical protein
MRRQVASWRVDNNKLQLHNDGFAVDGLWYGS